MRCDTCCRHVSNPYAHREYDCANWPELRLDQISVDYLGYTVFYVGGLVGPYEVHRGDYKISSASHITEAFMLIERQVT